MNRLLTSSLPMLLDSPNASSSSTPTFETADLYASFERSAKTRKGTETVTMTRATVAWEMDHENIWQKLDNNEFLFRGARRVKNYVDYPEDFSNDYWAKNATATVTGASQLNFPAASDYISGVAYGAEHLVVGAKNQSSIELWVDTVDVGKTIYLRYQLTGSGSGNEYFDRTITLTDVPTRYASPLGVCANSGQTAGTFIIGRFGGTNATKVYARKAQVEYFPQAATSPGVSEYVSRRKLSGLYHGANVDGVKYFSTLRANTVNSTTFAVEEKVGAPIPEYMLKSIASEGQATNLWQESVRVNFGYWAGGGFTKTVLSDVGVFGTRDGIGRLTGPGTTGVKSCRNNTVMTMTASAYNVFQVWVRPGTSTQRYTQYGLFDDTANTNGAYITYDAVTGTITETAVAGTGSLISYYVDPITIAGTVYHRIFAKIAFGNANTTGYFRHAFSNSATPGSLGPSYLDAGEYIDIAHVQVQTNCWGIMGLIPTTGGTATVNASSPLIANLSNVDTNGILAVTLQADYYRQMSGIGYLLYVNNQWNNHNAIGIAGGSAAAPGTFQMAGYPGGAFQDGAFYAWDGRNGKARVAFQYATGNHRMCVNGYAADYGGIIYSTARSAPSAVNNILLNGATARLYWKDLAIWNQTTSDQTEIVKRSIPKCRKFYIYEGDSLTDHSDNVYSVDRQVRALMGNPVDLVICVPALGASKIQIRGGKGTPMYIQPSVRDRTPFVQAAFASSDAIDKQLSFQIGINDRISSPIITKEEVYANIVAYCTDIKTTNPDVKISIETNTAYSTGTTAQDLAALLRAGFGVDLPADYLADFGADPDFDDATATLNTTYYNADRLHYSLKLGRTRQAKYKIEAHNALSA